MALIPSFDAIRYRQFKHRLEFPGNLNRKLADELWYSYDHKGSLGFEFMPTIAAN
jgi:hypothetical protein